MGPRPFGRGRDGAPDRFGQAGRLQWGRDLSAAEGCGVGGGGRFDASFNGAATFRPRKDLDARIDQHKREWLQWGRDLSAAEGGAAAWTHC